MATSRVSSDISSTSSTILGASSYCYPEKEDPLDGCRLAALYGLPNGAHWDQVPELKLFDRTFSASNLSRKQARAARMIVFSWGEAWCQVCTSQKQAYHGSVTTDVLQWFFFGFLDKCKACLDLPLGPLQPWFLVSHRILSWPPSPNKSSVRSSRVLDDTHVRWSWPQLFFTELNYLLARLMFPFLNVFNFFDHQVAFLHEPYCWGCFNLQLPPTCWWVSWAGHPWAARPWLSSACGSYTSWV